MSYIWKRKIQQMITMLWHSCVMTANIESKLYPPVHPHCLHMLNMNLFTSQVGMSDWLSACLLHAYIGGGVNYWKTRTLNSRVRAKWHESCIVGTSWDVGSMVATEYHGCYKRVDIIVILQLVVSTRRWIFDIKCMYGKGHHLKCNHLYILFVCFCV